MTALDITAFASALKRRYSDQKVAKLSYEQGPLYGLVRKNTKFGGVALQVPIQTGLPQGRSVSFATAQTNKSPGQYKDFLLTRVKDYALASIENETIEASENDADALLRAAESEIEGAIRVCGLSLANAMYRDGTGYRGKVGTYAAGPPIVLTLTDAEDVVNFEVGMVVQDYDNVGTTASVSAVDRDAGTITVSAGVWATGGVTDYIIQHGDKDGMIKGVGSWLPAAAPGAAAFFGVDRSVDPTRLGGVRIAATAGESIESLLIRAASRLKRERGKPDYCFMNPADVATLTMALQSKVNYPVATVNVKSADGLVGFEAIKIAAPSGTINVVGDLFCPVGVAYMLTMSTWTLHSLNQAPHFLTGKRADRLIVEATADAWEVRVGYYAQLGCNAPGWNARLTLPA